MKTAETFLDEMLETINGNSQASLLELIQEIQADAQSKPLAELTEEEQDVIDLIKWPIANLHKHVYFHLSEEGQVHFINANIKLLNDTFAK